VLLLSGAAFADYVERVDVFVADAYNRGIPNADVWAYYKINQIKGYVSTLPIKTNASGIAHLEFFFTEKDESKAVYDYTIYAKYPGGRYDGPNAQNSIAYNAKTVQEITAYIKLGDVYGAWINVFDADNRKPIQCNITLFDDFTKQADAYGSAYFEAPAGVHEVFVDINGMKKIALLNVTNETRLDIPIGIYTFNMTVADEFGNPLSSTLIIQNATFPIAGASTVTVMSETPIVSYSVLYGAKEKSGELNLRMNKSASVSFDLSPPNITVREISEDATGTTIKADIKDSGIYASGVSPSKPPKLFYTITKQNQTLRGSITLTPSGGLFMGRVPEPLELGILEYEIDAYDKEDNMNTYLGSFTGKYTPGTGGNETNGTDGTTPPPAQDSTMTYVAIGVGVAIFIGILYYIKKKFFE